MSTIKKRLLACLFCVTFMLTDILSPVSVAFATTNVPIEETLEENWIEDGEVINDIDPGFLNGNILGSEVNLSDVEVITNSILATPANALLKEEVEFTGIQEELVTLGVEIDLKEGIHVETENLDMDLEITPLEVLDTSGNQIPISQENSTVVLSKKGNYTVKYMAVADREDIELINAVAQEMVEVPIESIKEEITQEFNKRKQGESERQATSSNASLMRTGFRNVGVVPVAFASRNLITLSGLPSGNPQATHTTDATTGIYSKAEQVGMISYKGANIGGDVEGAYIELKAPIKHLDTKILDANTGRIQGLNIGTSGFVDRVEYTRENIGGEEYIVAKAYLHRIISTTDAEIPYTIKFSENRLVPEDYRLPVDADLKVIGENNAWADLPVLDYGIKYDPQKINMYLVTNNNSNFKKDSISNGYYNGTFGGTPDPSNEYIQTAINVPFMFKMETRDSSSPGLYHDDKANRHRQRLLKQIDIEVDLPTYIDKDNQSVPATFDLSSNPNWSVVQTDAQGRAIKVKYNSIIDPRTLEEVITASQSSNTNTQNSAKVGADALLDTVKLNLKFPNLPINQIDPNTDVAKSLMMNTMVGAKVIPFGASADELAGALAVENALMADRMAKNPYGTTAPIPVANTPAASSAVNDGLIFNIFRDEINKSGMIDKYADNTYLSDGRRIPLITDSMADTHVYYGVRISNGIASSSLKQVSIKDYLADPRTYYRSVSFRFWGGEWRKMKRIWALDIAGNRDRVIHEFSPADFQSWLPDANWNTFRLDTVAEDTVKGYAEQVDNGTLASDQVPAATRNIHGFEVELDPNYELPSGRSMSFRVSLGFLDPYHLTSATDRVIENTAELKGMYTSATGIEKSLSDVTDIAEAELVPGEERIGFSKIAKTPSGTTGSTIKYRLELRMDGVSAGRWFRNPKLIEVLPKGLEYESYTWGDPELTGDIPGYNPFLREGQTVDPTVVETIEDYQGSGRQAVIFKFPDFKTGQMNASHTAYMGRYFRIVLHTKITDNALSNPIGLSSSDLIGNANTSLNRAYFTADNLYNDLVPGSSTFKVISSNSSDPTNPVNPGFIEDTFDVDNNPATTQVLGSRASINITKARAIEAFKEIRSIQTPGYTGWRRNFVRTDYGAEYDYRLLFINTKTDNVGNLTVYDILPYVGDQPYAGHPDRIRDSEFRDRLRGAIQSPDPNAYKIFYSTANPILDSKVAIGSPAMAWTENLPADPTTVTAFKIEMQPGHVIATNQEVAFIVPMLAPEKPVGDLYTTEKATNNYAVSFDGNQVFGVSNAVSNYILNEIPVEKVWEGGNNHPTIEARLLQDGVIYTSALYPDGKITLDNHNAWKNSFKGIPLVKEDGMPYTYTIEEIGAGTGLLADYTTAIKGSTTKQAGSIQGFQIINAHKRDIPARIDWYDGIDTTNDGIVDTSTNRDGVRPNSVKVKLQRSNDGGNQYMDVPVDPNNASHTTAITTISKDIQGDYKHLYTNMPVMDEQGKPYLYRILEIDEPNLSNYPTTLLGGQDNRVSSVETDGTLVVSNIIQRYPLSVTKVWDDATNPTVRPTSIQLKVQRKTGTNAPTDVIITGVDTTKTLPENHAWTTTFTDLIRYDENGVEFDYSVFELPSTELNNYSTTYTPSVRLGGTVGISVTNSLGNYGLRVENTWEDNNNVQGVRPSDTVVKLYRSVAGGVEEEVPNSEKTISPISHATSTLHNWIVEYTNIPKYNAMGQEYTYRVEQLDKAGLRNYNTYYPVATGVAMQNPEDSVLKVHNTIHLLEKEVKKVWEDDDGLEAARPNIQVHLYRRTLHSANERLELPNGNPLEISLTPTNQWTDHFRGMLKYNANGEEYIYEAQEQGVGIGALARYEAPVYQWNVNGDQVTITNRLRIPSLNVRIDWVDANNQLVVRPEMVKVQLQRQVLGGAFTNFGLETEIGASTNWQYRFKNTPEHDEHGNPYTYRVVEIDSPALNNYPAILENGNPNRVFSLDGETLVITNQIQTIQLDISKEWNDNSDAHGIRPNNVEIHLLREGLEYRTHILDGMGDIWNHTFVNLAKYTPDGVEYNYTITEVQTPNLANYIANYTGTVDTGLKVNNTLVPTTVSGMKTWAGEVYSSLRPSSLRIHLYRSDAPSTVYRSVDIHGGNANIWAFTFDNLLKYAPDGTEYIYTVAEDIVPQYYEQSIDGYHITNTYRPNPISITPEIIKNVTGRHIPINEKYQFAIESVGTAPMPTENKILTSDGRHSFMPITFTTAGNYEYKIYEVAGNTEGYTYDTSIYKLKVQVVDQMGNLQANLLYEKDGNTVSEAIFYNTYIRPEANLSISKRLINDRKNEGEDFFFEIKLDTTEEFDYIGVNKTGKIKNGDRFSLKHNEKITILALPIGLKYEIIELDNGNHYPTYFNNKNMIERLGSNVRIENRKRKKSSNSGVVKSGGGRLGGSGSDIHITIEEIKKETIDPLQENPLQNNTTSQEPNQITEPNQINDILLQPSGTEILQENPRVNSRTRITRRNENEDSQVASTSRTRINSPINLTDSERKLGRGAIPKTIDENNPIIWALLLLASILGFAKFFITKNEKDKDK